MSFLDSTQLSEVDKMFQDANLKRMSQVGQLLGQTAKSLTGRVQSQKEELSPEDERPRSEILGALRATIDGKLPAIRQAIGPVQRDNLELWKEKVDGYMHSAQDDRTIDRHLIFCHEFNAQLDVWHAALNHPEDVWRIGPVPVAEQEQRAALQRYAYIDVIDRLKRFATDESLTMRFQGIFLHPHEKGGLVLRDHTQMAQCFRAFYLSQKQGMGLEGEGPVMFARHANTSMHNFSVERFLRAEELTLQQQLEADHSLNLLWEGIAARVHPGPNPPQTTIERRAWMNDAQNAPALEQVTTLKTTGFRRLPPEIGKLQGLTILFCLGGEHGRLTSLPTELINLPQLSSLFLIRNNFREIPSVIERLPGCNELIITNNQSLITVFPETIARKYANGWRTHLFKMLIGATGNAANLHFEEMIPNIRIPSNFHYVGLDPEVMTDIPFCMWFMNYFSLPYIPLIDLAVAIGQCLDAFRAFAQNLWAPLFYPVFGITWVIGIPIVLAIGLLGLLINLPIFLFNLGMHWYIEPVISAFRSCLGYAPMIHYDPQPAAAQ